MIRQEFYLEDWDWMVQFFYEAGRGDAAEVVAALEDVGCRGRDLERAERLLERSGLNNGITHSNRFARASVVVLTKTSSADQFMNSYDHEKGHLCRDISQTDGIDPYGEEAEYLAGKIGELTFRVARRFLCEHCRCR